MEFWSGIGNTILIVGLASCLFVFVISLALPELAPPSAPPSKKRVPIERWLQLSAIAFTIAVSVELASPWLNENVVGLMRVCLTFVGLGIVFALLTRASTRLQERFRRR